MAKKAAYGTRLFITDPADTSVFRVHHIGDISGPEVNVEMIDVTSHDSPEFFAEHVAGIADAGEVTFELFFDPTDGGHERIQEMVAERETTTFSLVLPGTSGEFVTEPNFGTVSGEWTGSGSWSVINSDVSYASADPGASQTLTTAVTGLLLNEQYTIAVAFRGASVGTAAINVKLFGAVVGTVTPSNGGTQYVRVDAIDTDGDLTLEVPSSIAGAFEFELASVSLIGITDNTEERFDFTGLITKVGILAPYKESLKAPVSIKVNGKPAYTSSAP